MSDLQSSGSPKLHGKSFIGFQEKGQGESFQSSNPATNDLLPTEFVEASSQNVDAAVELARHAFETYRLCPAQKKADFLNATASNLRASSADIIAIAQQESALPEGRLTGELERTAGQLELFASLVAEGSWCDARIDEGGQGKADIRRFLSALGPVAVFGSSNFPLAFSVAGGDTASALAAGCPVVVKGHPSHPGTSERVARVIVETAQQHDLPEGVFSLLQSSVPDISIALVKHSGIAAVGFTGSGKVGRILYDAAAQRPEPIPVFCEMGSINPVFILPSALEDAPSLAAGLANSLTLGAGQFCTNPGITVLIDSSEARAFAKNVAIEVNERNKATMLNAGIFQSFCRGVESFLSTEGVTLLSDEPDHSASKNAGANAVFSTDAQTFLKLEHLQEEVFGPLGLIVFCKDEQERLELARHLQGHLTATLHASEAELSSQTELINVLTDKVGRLIFNGFPTGVAVNHAMQHGGTYPASTDARFTSVGSAAILRFVKPICYQDCPDALLPPELQRENPRGIWRRVNGELTKE